MAGPLLRNDDLLQRPQTRVLNPSTRAWWMAAARLWTLTDLRAASPTVGCLDRAYWHYRMPVDFPSAAFQVPMLAIATLADDDHPENPFRHPDRVREWASAALGYWARIQNRDGSFNEWYRRERSYCATAFSTWSAAETLRALGSPATGPLATQVHAALRRSAAWLIRQPLPLVSNQAVAALNALSATAEVTGDASIRLAGQNHLDRCLTLRHPEGWFPEYEGPDIGYGLVTLDLWARYYVRNPEPRVWQAMEQLLDFLYYFIHPDGTCGGAYGSRGTCHPALYGLAVMAAKDPRAAEMRQRIERGIARDPRWGAASADDRYMSYFYANSWALARQVDREQQGQAPAQAEPCPWGRWYQYFSQAGLVSIRTDRYQAVVGLSRGGVLRLYDREKLIFEDTGYTLTWPGGGVWTSAGWVSPPSALIHDRGPDHWTIVCQHPFCEVPRTEPSRLARGAFRLLQETVLRHEGLAGRFNRWLKGSLRRPQPRSGVCLHRQIDLRPDGIRIEDRIDAAGTGIRVRSVGWEPQALADFSPSARQYSPQAAISKPFTLGPRWTNALASARAARWIRTIPISSEGRPEWDEEWIESS